MSRWKYNVCNDQESEEFEPRPFPGDADGSGVVTSSGKADLAASAALKRNFLFRGLPEALINRIASIAQRRTLAKGTTVFEQGDAGDALYGVISGRVRINASGPDGREVFLNIMEPGDTFGEIAVIDGLPRTAGAVAISESTLFQIRRADFLALLETEAILGKHLLVLFCQRLRWTSDLVEESAFLEGPARLARRLLVLAELHGRQTEAGLELAIAQSELALFLGISRQFVNQNLQAWRNEGWVSLGRGRISIADQAALELVAVSTSEAAER